MILSIVCRPSLTDMPLKGLFFLPMHKENLTSFSVEKGWHYYFDAKRRDTNLQASSPLSYFGLTMLAFSARQSIRNQYLCLLLLSLFHKHPIAQLKRVDHSSAEKSDCIIPMLELS